MKLIVALTLCLALSATNVNAGFLDTLKGITHSIGDGFKNLFHNIQAPLESAATHILTDLKQEGSKLLSSGLTGVTQLLQPTTTTTTRDLELMSNINNFLAKGQDFLDNVANTLHKVFTAAMSEMGELVGDIDNLKILGQPLSKFVKSVEDVVLGHHAVMDAIMEDISKPITFLEDAAKNLVGDHQKRSFGDSLSALTTGIKNTFQPFIDNAKSVISGLGKTVTNMAQGVVNVFKPTVDSLKTKLGQHVQTFKNLGQEFLGHGQTALSALGDAASDIFAQTLNNAGNTVQKAVETATDASKVAINTLTGGN